MTEPDRVARANGIAEAALDKKCLQLVALDMREVTSVADTFLLMTGTSDRHARSIADGIVECVRASGEKPLGVEGYDEGRWVLIDLGDVIVQDDDVYGDGVNVAARLEGLAEPGGIVVSGMVHEAVRAKVDVAFDDLGPQSVKNIAEPVHAYSIATVPSP